MEHVSLFRFLSAQNPTSVGSVVVDASREAVKNDYPDWPYWIAITTLAGVVGTLFTLYVRTSSKASADVKALNDKHQARIDELSAERVKELRELNKQHADATEEKARRVAEDFERKDKALLSATEKFATLIERVVNELRALNDRDGR